MTEQQSKKPSAVVIPLFPPAQQAERLFTRAMSLDEQPDHWREAEALYRQVVRLVPKHDEAWCNLGVMRYRRGAKMKALDAWARALLANPDSESALNNVGFFWQEEGKYELAVEYLRRSVRIDPEQGEARVNLALCLQSLGRFVEARRHWQSYMRRFPRGVYAEMAERNETVCAGTKR